MVNSANDIKVTVLMPAYNADKYIAEAIDSVLKQSFTDFELLIVNDGSTDNTEQIIRSFTDPRIVLINQPNGGVAKALNHGLQCARAKYIVRFDADDICYPERLRIQYNFMEANPGYILAGSDAKYIDKDGEFIFSYQCDAHTDEEIRQLPVRYCPFLHVTVIYKKKEVEEVGGYNENAHTFEDHLLWSVLIKKGKLFNIPRSLVKVRFNPESVTIDESWRGQRFKILKYQAIRNGFIRPNEADEILQIIRQQDNSGIKNGSYYSLLAKKYLWNNYHPVKARKNIRYLIRIHPFNIEAYILWVLSLLPAAWVKAVYKQKIFIFKYRREQRDN